MRSTLVVPVLLAASGAAFFLAHEGAEARAGTQVAAASSSEPSAAGPQEARGDAPAPAREAQPLSDAPLEAYRRQLLDFAYTTASLVPMMPHVKTRSRLQDEVVAACLELDQARSALEYVEGIDNWLRGACYADLAFHLARTGRGAATGRLIDEATGFVERMQLLEDESVGEVDDGSIEGYQSWRKDRIRAKLARTYLALGDEAGATTFAAGLEPSEAGIYLTEWAEGADASAIAEQVRILEHIAGTADFERVQTAVEVGFVLLERFHADAEHRVALDRALQACLDAAPIGYRIDGHLRLARMAAEHGATEAALGLADGTERILAQTPLHLEDALPLAAHVASLHARLGRADAARERAEAALARYDEGRDGIASLYRAETLAQIAVAFVELGDRARALEIYRRAVEDGSVNPNAVPRAEDLCGTLVSMAVHSVEPDAALWARMREIHAGLRQPW